MNQIQYIHRRPFTATGPYAPASRGGFTVAYQEIKPGLIEYSIATCSTCDNFNKKLGRAIATGRLANNKTSEITGVTMKEFRDIMYAEPV